MGVSDSGRIAGGVGRGAGGAGVLTTAGITTLPLAWPAAGAITGPAFTWPGKIAGAGGVEGGGVGAGAAEVGAV